MNMNWELIIRGLLAGWWFANFTPLQNMLTKHVKPKIPAWAHYFSESLSCFKCQSFWWTLGITLDPFAAIMAAAIAYTYDRIMNSLKMYF
jgi:hypothetical protein